MRQDAFSTPKGRISYLKFKYEIWWKWFEIDVGLLGLVSRHFHIVIRLTFFCGSPIILHFALTQAYWSSLLSSGSALFTRQWIRTSAFSSEHFHDDNNNHAHTNQTYEELKTPAMQGGECSWISPDANCLFNDGREKGVVVDLLIGGHGAGQVPNKHSWFLQIKLNLV